MLELKLILQQKLRFGLTVSGIALCSVLMLFLLSVYRGVAVGSIAYIRNSDADFWIMQKHATNILRSTSLLLTATGEKLKKFDGIKSISPILFVMASTDTPKGPATLFLTGYNSATGFGGPPKIVDGHSINSENQIILDRSFAAKYRLQIGEWLLINGDSLKVVGLSSGTNMFVIQYAFIDIRKLYSLIEINEIATCFQVRLDAKTDPHHFKKSASEDFPNLAFYPRETFIENNVKEMESGLLPLLFMVAFISAVVLSAIISLILTVSVLERRMDYAIIKIIGCPRGFTQQIIIKQAMIFAISGLTVALILYYPLTKLIELASPEISTVTSLGHVIWVLSGVIIISLCSSITPCFKLNHIYPLDVFK